MGFLRTYSINHLKQIGWNFCIYSGRTYRIFICAELRANVCVLSHPCVVGGFHCIYATECCWFLASAPKHWMCALGKMFNSWMLWCEMHSHFYTHNSVRWKHLSIYGRGQTHAASAVFAHHFYFSFYIQSTHRRICGKSSWVFARGI